MTHTAYPLSWPLGYARTSPIDRRAWQDAASLKPGAARDSLLVELARTGATSVILSTNIPTRNDGVYYATAKEPTDPGVAVYFTLGGEQQVLCCDQYTKVSHNARAIALTVQQLRQISKRGVSDFLRRAFAGFKALPEQAPARDWWTVLDVPAYASWEQIRRAYREKAKFAHPDAGGSREQMHELNEARAAGAKACGVEP